MPDTDETTSAETTEEATSTEATETTEDTAPEGDESEGDSKDAELPDWAKKRLTKANSEAARYRTQVRELEARLEGVKTPEEVEAAVAEIRAQNAALEAAIVREKVARKHELPDELAELLKGSTEEELTAHAKSLAKYATPHVPETLSGGLDPSDNEGAFDPVALAREARARRY